MWRLWTIFLGFSLLFATIVLRLFYWQVVRGDALRSQAAAQYFVEFTLPASRGTILASDGSPLAMNQPGFLVYGQPKEIKNIPSFAHAVSSLIAKDEASVAAALSVPGRVWVPLVHKADQPVADALKKLELKGLGLEQESKRYYPEASMAAHILGFVGLDQNGNDKGYFGLEGFYDRLLRGKDGKLEVEKDVHGAPILVGEATRIEPENGRSLRLWTDRTIQNFVEKRLSEGIAKYGAKEGTIIVMDPKTGGILAMANFPAYNPATFSSFERELYKNPAVASTYEPGSTFKVLVMAAALNENLITPTTTVNEDGPIEVGEYAIRTWDNKYRGVQTMMEVLQHSSNVGMVFVQRKLGKEKFLPYLKAFGLGAVTGIDLEDEAVAVLRPDDEWREIDLVTASFGQGIAVTPLAMVRAVGALANGGMLMEPHVVQATRDDTGREVPIRPVALKQVVRPAAARVITEMMIHAVDTGEAKWAKPKGYRIAGKTGTAQIPVAGHYDATKTIASFVGFAPADDPKFVMLVTLREPSSSQWGSETAAPLFFRIAKGLFSYYKILPTSQ